MSEIFDFDPIDDNNTTRWPENMLAQTVNNSARADEGILARDYRDRTPYAQTSGTSTAYTLTSSRTITALTTTTRQMFRAHVACGASPTFNLNGIGAFPIRKNFNVALGAGEISAGQIVEVAWDATNSAWQLLSTTSTTLNNQAFGLKVGDVKLSMSSSPDAGFIRLKETAQSISSTAYPDLYAWLQAQGFPWGSGAGTANVPPAAGYVLRFAANNSSVDTSGARLAGSTQADQNKTATVPIAGVTASSTATSTVSGGIYGGTTGVSFAGGGANVTPSIATLVAVSTSVSTTLSGSSTLPGGDEVRVKNVAMHADMLATPALVASGLIGVGGLAYKFNTSTATADPGAGYFSLNNATIASATQLYINETDANGTSLASVLAVLPAATMLYITKVGAPSNFIALTLSSVATDNGSWNTFTLSAASSGGTIASGDSVAVTPFLAGGPGGLGPTGATGPNVGLDYAWSTATSGDPGSGKVLVNNAAPASATQLNISETNRRSANQAPYIATWDDSTTTAARSVIRIMDVADPGANFLEYMVTGPLTDAGAYDTFPVTYIGGAGTIANGTIVSVMNFRTGNAGGGSGDLVSTNNLSDVTNKNTARDNLTLRGADIASAAAINLTTATGSLVDVTGTTAITAITLGDGLERTVRFTGVLTLTNGASLVLPSGANITTAAGDYAIFRGYAAGVVRCVLYSKASGAAVVGGSSNLTAQTFSTTLPPIGDGLVNIGIAASVATNALTIALKGADGNDPSSTNPVLINFRNVTAATGTPTALAVTAALSLTVSAGSTLGTSNVTPFRAWLVLFNDSGTARIGIVNCVSGRSILPLNEAEFLSSTAEGGAGAADSAQVVYTGTAVTSKAFRIIGFVEYASGLTTAGTYNSAPTKVQIYGPGVPRPGQPTGNRNQVVKTDTFTSTTTGAYTDITGFNVAITPQSACNLVRVVGAWNNIAGAANIAATQLVRGSAAIDVGDAWTGIQATSTIFRTSDAVSVNFNGCDILDSPAAATSQTYKIQFYLQGDTYYFNRSITSAASPQPRTSSTIAVEEIMG